jgi:hypothetical protein
MNDYRRSTMQRLIRWAVIGSAVFVGACSNGPRNGFDTMGAGAAPGESGGAPAPVTAAGSVSPTMTTPDTSKRATTATPAKPADTTGKKGTAKKP